MIDVSALPFMPLYVDRLLASDTWSMATGDEAKAMVTLWARSWKQVPAGTLPDDERILAALSGAGRDWRKVREVALRGFVRGDDGRLRHPLIEDAAQDALAKMRGQQTRTAAARAARAAKREAERKRLEGERNNVCDRERDTRSDRVSDSAPDSIQREREHKPPTVPSEPPGEERAARKRAPTTPKPAAKTPLPANFAISDRVREWAADKGHTRLDERFEDFVGKVRQHGYRYADWDEALMTAIRMDWAKLAGKPADGAVSRLTPAGQRTAESLTRWINEEPRDGTTGP